MSDAVLVLDDDAAMGELLSMGLGKHGYDVETFTNGQAALDRLEERAFSVVITDLNLTEMSGLDICEAVVRSQPDVAVIVMTAFGDMKAAVSAIRAGAHDFINKPVELETLAHAVERAAQLNRMREEISRLSEAVGRSRSAGKLIGESPGMKRVYDLVHRVADADAAVLVTGESGTGKELVARALHSESSRSAKPFVALNCAAVPANLLESELFGHVRGAFTGAQTSRKGLFERADGGTVFLDEVAEMPAEMQATLLRVLQEKRVRPVGGDREITFEARVVTATNRDLETEVEEGRFREDLYYRLNVVQIHLPGLRARGNDILLLAQHFINDAAERLGRGVTTLSSDAAIKLLEFDWPGNVRQLQNSMERAVTLTRYDQITLDDLPPKIRDYESTRIAHIDVDPEHMLTLAEVEQRYIERVLGVVDGNKTQAAKVLGLDRRTLYRKLDRYAEEAKDD